MNVFRAINLIEGFEEPEDAAETIEAWQHLLDTGVVWQLQGSYGRFALGLIEDGVIAPKKAA